MNLVDAARRFVVRTNGWPGAGALYTRAYDLGLASVVARIGAVDDVQAVMLRVNDDGHRWVPGLSDYDLTVIVARRDAVGTLRLLDDLWERYRSIKRWVPQLGEMDVVDAEEYGDLLDFGPMPTWSLKCDRPLFVREGRAGMPDLLARPRRRSRPEDFLLDAMARFGRYVMPAWLDHSSRRTGLTRRRVEHLLANVVARIRRLGVEVETADRDRLALRVARVAQALSAACRRVEPFDSKEIAVVDRSARPIPESVLSPLRTFCEDAVRRAPVAGCSAVVWTPYMSATTLSLQFVVPDETGPEEMARMIEALASPNASARELMQRLPALDDGRRYAPEGVPLFATRSVWRRWRKQSPFDGVAVAVTGRTLVGADDVGDWLPSWPALRRHAENSYAALLPIKNIRSRGGVRPDGRLYAAVIDHANGYASAFSARVATVPVALASPSIVEAYAASTDALRELGARLRAAPGPTSVVAGPR